MTLNFIFNSIESFTLSLIEFKIIISNMLREEQEDTAKVEEEHR